MRIVAVIIITLISSCGQPDDSKSKLEAEAVGGSDSEKLIDSASSEQKTEIGSIYPDWLKAKYPTELAFEFGHTISQEIKDYQIVNDSVSFCVYKQMDGVCSRVILDSYIKQTKTDSLEIGDNCDHDASYPVYSWTEYEAKPSNLFVLNIFTESVVDSFLTVNGEIKGDFDFNDAETKIDSTQKVYQVIQTGLIQEIKK